MMLHDCYGSDRFVIKTSKVMRDMITLTGIKQAFWVNVKLTKWLLPVITAVTTSQLGLATQGRHLGQGSSQLTRHRDPSFDPL